MVDNNDKYLWYLLISEYILTTCGPWLYTSLCHYYWTHNVSFFELLSISWRSGMLHT